jgi:NhaP-type Na+/H+ or K+/H+ antiporter
LDPYIALLAVVGVTLVAAAMLPRLIHRAPLSMPIIYLGIGLLLFALPIGLEGPRVGAASDGEVAERLTEFVVIVSLMGAGLKLNRPVGWRSWAPTWRLLGITMPLTILAVTLLGGLGLGLPLAGAVLLGAVLAPTDPVLASDVQVDGPDLDTGETLEEADDEVRFALTSEAGLNDALAFPFTYLAIALAAGGSWFVGWVVHDVVVKIAVGLLAGWLLGRVVAWLAFRLRSATALARTSEGFVAVGATLAVYGTTELAHGYGFLAVFVAAVTIRNQERDHEYQQVLHDFAETVERLASVVFLILLGGAIVEGALGALTWAGVAVAVAIVLLVRPVAGWIGLLGSPIRRPERAAIAFFGVRGMGTIYYLAYAATKEQFEGAAEIWSVGILVIVLSIVVHGIAAGTALRHLDAARALGGPPEEDGSGPRPTTIPQDGRASRQTAERSATAQKSGKRSMGSG